MSTAYILSLLWLTFISVYIYLFATTTLYLIGHSRRESIQFYNFNQKIKYFNTKMSLINETLFIIYEVGLSFFTFFILLSPMKELQVYWRVSLIFIVITIFVHLIWRILRGMDKDVSKFYNNYQIAIGALKKKQEAEKSIKNTKNYRSKIISFIESFEIEIKKVTDPEEYHLRNSVTIIDEFVSSQTKTINSYEKDIISRFNKTLSEYFEKEIKIDIELPQTNINFDVEFNNVRSEIYKRYQQIFNETLYDLIKTNKFKTSESITKGLQILKDNEYDPTQDLIELILLSIDHIDGSPRELVDYLINKKIVELENLISYAINKKIVWVFKSNLFETQDQLSTISERLIKEDAYTLAIAFISNYFSRLKTVLAFIDKQKELNKTTKLFNNYRKVMDVDQAFFAEHKVLENKVMSIKKFFEGKNIADRVKRDLQDISNLPKAYENKETIDNLYSKIQDNFDDLKSNAIQSLLLYSGIKEDDNLFDLIKTSKTINDLYNRLMINDLIVASLLLYTLFIKHNDDEELHSDVITILDNDEQYKKLLSGVNLNIGYANRKELSKMIMRNVLLKKEQERISNIILKVEKDRRTLDVLASS